MYFFQGYTIHAGYEVPQYNASHGCIRVLPSAAKWLNEQFITLGTQVIVLSYEDENGDGHWLQPKTPRVEPKKQQPLRVSSLRLRPRGRRYA
jgi:hypothetical protein